MTNLKQAREQGKLKQFIKERSAEKGDPTAFNRVVQAMAQTSPEAPKASSPRNPDD
jgi:hypothetical protein